MSLAGGERLLENLLKACSFRLKRRVRVHFATKQKRWDGATATYIAQTLIIPYQRCEGLVGFKQRLAPRNAAEVEICGP